MDECSVVISGAGPTGLMLAAELTLAGTDVVVLERRPTRELDGSRAGGLHARTLEVLDQRGIAERFIDAGQVHPAASFAQTPLDLGDFPSRHNYVLALWQSRIEEILAAWVGNDLGVEVRHGCELAGFEERDDVVDVTLGDGSSIRSRYLVGCDGGRSLVRKLAGIDFAGWDPTTSWMIAEVEMDDTPPFGFRRNETGTHAIGRRAPDEPIRVVLTEGDVGPGEPTLDELRAALISVYGSDYGLRHAGWISRFTDTCRQAVAYRRGRILLAGDAAHVHPPQGGQGLNTGVQDAVNLGWKLAQVVAGTSPDTLLDSYHAERHPVGARVLQNTMAQVVLSRVDARHEALRDTLAPLLRMDEPRRSIAAMLTALDIHYDLGHGHPLRGRRMPDLDLRTADGSTRVYALLHEARPLLLVFDEGDRIELGAWSERVRRVDAEATGPWALPVLGEVPAPPAVLIRPDGHVAWAGDDDALADALERWFGPAQQDIGKVDSRPRSG